MARKREQLAEAPLVDFYLTLGRAIDRSDDDAMLIGLADKIAAYLTRLADDRGDAYVGGDIEPSLADLLDTLAFDTAPPARRLVELLIERGWTGWTKLERGDSCSIGPGGSGGS